MSIQTSIKPDGKAEKRYIFILFLVYLILTIISLSRMIIWEDEYHILFFQRVSGGVFTHTDITAYLHYLVYSLFGLSLVTEKIVPLAFSIASFFVFLRFLDENYDTKTRLIAQTAFCLLAWHVFFSSTVYVNNEASLTFLLASVLFISRYLKSSRLAELLISGMFMGLSFTVYETMLIFTLPVAAFLVVNRNTSRHNLAKEFFVFGCGVLGVAIVYMLALTAVFGSGSLRILIQWGLMDKTRFFDFGINYIRYYLFMLFRIFLYAGPLLLVGLMFVAFRKRTFKAERKNLDLLYLCFIAAAFFFYCVIVPPANHQVRYLAPLIPYLTIFAAKYISSLRIEWGELKSLVPLTTIILALLLMVNLQGVLVNIKDYAKSGVHILGSYFISVQPNDAGTTIMVGLLVISALISVVLFFASNTGKKGFKRKVRMILLSFCVGFSLFTTQEYIFHLSGVNFDSSYVRLYDYLKSNQAGVIYTNLNKHFITEAYNVSNDVSFKEVVDFTINTRLSVGGKEEYLITREKDIERFAKIYFTDTYVINDMTDAEAQLFFNKMISQNASIVLINNHNYYGEDTKLLKRLNSYCREKLGLRNRGYITGLVYVC